MKSPLQRQVTRLGREMALVVDGRVGLGDDDIASSRSAVR